MKKLILALVVLQLTHFPLSSQPLVKKVMVQGEGIPIVVLAGGTADMTVLSGISGELSTKYKVIRMEHFNVQYATEGKMLPVNYSIRMESEAIRNTLDSLNIIVPVVLVGHSYGGVIAFDFALAYPSKIRSLVLMEPPLFGIERDKHESPEGLQAMTQLMKELKPQAEITENQVARFRCALMNCDTLSIRSHPQWALWVKQKNRLRGLSVIDDYQVNFKKLRAFKKPVLVITGSSTVAFHKRIDHWLTTQLINGKEVFVPGGHTIPVTAPAEMIKALVAFIEKK